MWMGGAVLHDYVSLLNIQILNQVQDDEIVIPNLVRNL